MLAREENDRFLVNEHGAGTISFFAYFKSSNHLLSEEYRPIPIAEKLIIARNVKNTCFGKESV